MLRCLPLAVSIGLSPLLILTLCGSERVLVVLEAGGGGFGMTPWCDDLVCSWRRLLADRHSGGGGGIGWDPPPPRVPLCSPPKAGRKLISLNPFGAEDAEAKFWLSAPTLEGEEGGGGLSPLLLRCTAVLIHPSGGGGGYFATKWS